MSYDQNFYEEQQPPTPLSTKLIIFASGAVVIGALIAGLVTGIRGLSPAIGDGDTFVAISGQTHDGTAISTDDYQGKVLVIDFWATWCPPCREGIPSLIAVQDEFADKDVQVIGVSLDNSAQAVADFYSDKGVNFPSIYHGADEAARQYGVRSIPTTLVVDRDGEIVFRGVGLHDIRSEVVSVLE